MSKEKRQRTTVTVRLTDEEYNVLTRLCELQQTTRTAYLARVATRHAKQELLSYAVDEYRAGRVSLSELATRTGLDIPTIMEEVARLTGEDTTAVDGFLAAVKTLSQLHDDPELYEVARQAIRENSKQS